MTVMTIGQLATESGLSTDAIRFYEKQGLLAHAGRTHSGYRQYDPSSLERLAFITHAKAVGFTLEETRQLLLLKEDPVGSCAAVKAFGHQKLEEIERKLVLLTQMKASLGMLVNQCHGEGPSSECPILEGLKQPETHR